MAGYLTVSYDTEIANMPLKINAGVRYEDTHLDSQGVGRTPISLQVQSSDHTAYQVAFTDTVPLKRTNTYSYLLPNLDLNLSLTDDLKLRFDASRTLTRPPLNYLTPDLNFSQTPRVGALTGDRAATRT